MTALKRRHPPVITIVFWLAMTSAAFGVETDEGEERNPAHRTEPVLVEAKGMAADQPDALAVETLEVESAIARPADFQDLVIRVPGVGATGQNGLFETFSIRGSGANEIAILLSGVPLTAQRRAGVPVSFVEPGLLGEVSVTRGPAVVHYGPGALGGAVAIEPRWFASQRASVSYASGGDESALIGGFGGETFSLGIARHRANDTKAPDGTPLHTQFERVSAIAQLRRRIGALEIDGLLLPSYSEDIGKSNVRFPARDTIYPHDEHLIGRLRIRHDNGFEATVFGHDQALRTWNRRPGFADSFADVQGLDFGASLQRTLALGDFEHDLGLEYFARRGVDAFDARGSIDRRNYTLRDASEEVWSLFAISELSLTPSLILELGARHSTIAQSMQGVRTHDQASGVSVGAVWKPRSGHRFSLSLASGYRFPTLEERFYSGVTAQGEIVGNPDLGSERSLGIDLGHAWEGRHWRSELHLWRNAVADLIQLVPIAPDIDGFENVSDARLWGVEAMLGWSPTDATTVRGTVAVVHSRDRDSDRPLYGTPPPTAELETKLRLTSSWTFGARYQHRWALDDPGFEEVARKSVDLVDLELEHELGNGLQIGLYVRNLFDRTYFATADELSALAPERSVGMHLSWQTD